MSMPHHYYLESRPTANYHIVTLACLRLFRNLTSLPLIDKSPIDNEISRRSLHFETLMTKAARGTALDKRRAAGGERRRRAVSEAVGGERWVAGSLGLFVTPIQRGYPSAELRAAAAGGVWSPVTTPGRSVRRTVTVTVYYPADPGYMYYHPADRPRWLHRHHSSVSRRSESVTVATAGQSAIRAGQLWSVTN